MDVCEHEVGNKREEGKGRREPRSDDFGSLPEEHRLSAMFTLTALSPPAPDPEEPPARDQYPVQLASGRQPRERLDQSIKG